MDFVQGFSGGRIFGLLALGVGLVVCHGLLVFFVLLLLVYPEIECQIELVLSIWLISLGYKGPHSSVFWLNHIFIRERVSDVPDYTVV